jgi:hypothetical protein
VGRLRSLGAVLRRCRGSREHVLEVSSRQSQRPQAPCSTVHAVQWPPTRTQRPCPAGRPAGSQATAARMAHSAPPRRAAAAGTPSSGAPQQHWPSQLTRPAGPPGLRAAGG